MKKSKKNVKKIIFLILIIISINNTLLKSTTYYVKTTGSDTNSGLNWDNAWQTLQHAADIVTNGDTVLIAAGVYNTQGRVVDSYYPIFCITNSGTLSAPITFKAYTNNVILDAGTINAGIHIYKADYIIIDGLEIKNGNNNGICLNRSSQHIVIKNCIIHNNSVNGISIGRTIGTGGDYDSRGNCDYTLVKNCKIYNNGTGIYIYCSAGCSIESNILYKNNLKGGILIYARGNSTDINYIKYNISYSNSYGIQISYKNERADHKDTVIEHTILYNNGNDGVYAGCGYVLIENSIIYKNLRYGLYETDNGWGAWTTDLQSSYNDVCSNVSADYQSTVGIAPGTGDISYSPLFLTLIKDSIKNSFLLNHKYNKNYSISTNEYNSPCIDKGNPTYLVTLPDLREDIGIHNEYIGYPEIPFNIGPTECTNGAIRTISTVTLHFSLQDMITPPYLENLRYIIQIDTSTNFISPVISYTSSYVFTTNYIYISPALPPGNYYWRVRAEDNCQNTYGNKSKWRYANNKNIAFKIVNNDSILEWTGEVNYEKSGVYPISAISGTTFKFRVKYSDPNNKAPLVKELWIDLNDDGDYNDFNEKIDMKEENSSSSYTIGKIYTKNLVIKYSGDGILNYKFYFNNGEKDAQGTPANTQTLRIIEPDEYVKLLNNVISLSKNDKCLIEFLIQKKEDIIIKIFDLKGRIIKNIDSNNIILNEKNILTWDGKDNTNQKVSEGIFFIFFKAGNLELKEKIIVVK